MTFGDDSHSLWNFSIGLYGRPGVAKACLDLQDRLGADVNLLLFLVWWSALGRGDIDQDAFEMIARRATRWNDEVVTPFRTARMAAKGGDPSFTAGETDAVYRKMLDAELVLERAEQTIIERTAREFAPAEPSALPAADVLARLLDRYLPMIGSVPTPEEHRALAMILASAQSAAVPR